MTNIADLFYKSNNPLLSLTVYTEWITLLKKLKHYNVQRKENKNQSIDYLYGVT